MNHYLCAKNYVNHFSYNSLNFYQKKINSWNISYKTWKKGSLPRHIITSPRFIFCIHVLETEFISDLPVLFMKTKNILMIWCIKILCLSRIFFRLILLVQENFSHFIKRMLRQEYEDTFSRNETSLKNKNFAARIQIPFRSWQQMFFEHLLCLKWVDRY